VLSDTKNDNDLQLEEFKNNASLKHKVLQESVTGGHQRLGQLESRVKDIYNYLVKVKKQVQEL